MSVPVVFSSTMAEEGSDLRTRTRQKRLQTMMEELEMRPSPENSCWTYRQRREMQEILPDVFLGPYGVCTKNKLTDLQSLGISHIVCVRRAGLAKFIVPNFEGIIQYYTVTLGEFPPSTVLPHVIPCNRFIQGALAAGGRVLIHGINGISESAAIAIGYAMQSQRWSFEDAFKFVSYRRQCLFICDFIIRQLKDLEPVFQSMPLCGYQLVNRPDDATKKRPKLSKPMKL